MLPTRLRRQKIHASICVCMLLIMMFFLIWKTEWSIFMKVTMSIVYLICGLVTQSYEVAIRRHVDLIVRNVISSIFLFLIHFGFLKDARAALGWIVIFNVLYIIWLIMAKAWMRHEIAPGWTMLIYDGYENKRKAEAIAKRRPDLIMNACHLELSDGDCVVEKVSETVGIYHVTQAVICVEKDGSEILDYCNKECISVILLDKNKNILGNRRGRRLDKDGLYLIEPQSIGIKNGQAERAHGVTA